MKRYVSTLSVTAIISLAVLLFSTCMNEEKHNDDVRGVAYAGSEKCQSCHKNIYDTYTGTAHYLSSRAASRDVIKGSFSPDSNTFYYRPTLKVAMEQRDSGFYQVAYIDDIERQAHRFDIVFGSGRKGQSYAYWVNDYLFQLPISYFAPGKSWVNSPNFPPHNVKFDRNIPIGCFECHGSYIKKTFVEVAEDRLIDHMDKNQVAYGIDCERCHGPAAKHVAFHEENPAEKKAQFIILHSSLSKNQKLDMCAMCHSGPGEIKKTTFDFVPGDTLSNFLFRDTAASINGTDIDVHGKQFQVLSKSKCFIKSNVLDCSSCHNTHVKERENIALFSQRCMNCHNTANHNFCKMAPELGENIVSNCIDCHMPARPSKLITLQSQTLKKPIPALVRTHFISIYPEATSKFMNDRKSSK